MPLAEPLTDWAIRLAIEVIAILARACCNRSPYPAERQRATSGGWPPSHRELSP
jgi:hypothetical protein